MWKNPLDLKLVPTLDSDSFKVIPAGYTGLPIGQHCGAFGVQRKNHVHEGVDLYCREHSPVYAVEDGQVVAVIPFTGEIAKLPWWHNTHAVLVEGKSGVVVYGEIAPMVWAGEQISAGDTVGKVVQVLKIDKGRPMSMLHLELHTPGTRICPPWDTMAERPITLLDPTPYLLKLCGSSTY